MRAITHLTLASILAITITLACSSVAQANAPAIRVLHNGQHVQLLAPGAAFEVLLAGLGTERSTLCLGLTSLRDRYGLPVSLGAFHSMGTGMLAISTTIPLTVFPAEPPGPFLLFAGRCTDVAPDGIYAGTTVSITPAAG